MREVGPLADLAFKLSEATIDRDALFETGRSSVGHVQAKPREAIHLLALEPRIDLIHGKASREWLPIEGQTVVY